MCQSWHFKQVNSSQECAPKLAKKSFKIDKIIFGIIRFGRYKEPMVVKIPILAPCVSQTKHNFDFFFSL